MLHAETSPPHFVCTAHTRAQIVFASSAWFGAVVEDAGVIVGATAGPAVLLPLHAPITTATNDIATIEAYARIAATLARPAPPWHDRRKSSRVERT